MKKIVILVFVVVTALATTSFIKNSSGKVGFTNAPGEGTCNTCHGGGASISTGATITSVPAFTANQYVPGTTYMISVNIAAIGFNNYGFDCVILGSTNTDIGNMQNAASGVQFLNAGNGRKNATHTATKAGTNGTSFSFEWTAPTSGNATIYACGNAVNGTGGTGGDIGNITTSLSITTASTVGIKQNNSITVSQISISPNPVSDIMTINYLLSKSENLSIELIDINGSVIKQLLNQKAEAGFNNHTINLQDVAKGVYFIKMASNSQKIAQKLVIIN